MTDIRIKVVQGREGLYSVRTDWEYITDNMREKRYYHMYQWYSSYLDSLERDNSSVYFFLFYSDETPVAVFPLKKNKIKIYGLNFNILEIPDHSHFGLSDFITSRKNNIYEFTASLKEYLRKSRDIKCDFICAQHVMEDSPFYYARDLSPHWVLHETIGKSNYLVSTSYEKINEKLTRNFRGNLRKARNKLMKFDDVEFETVRNAKELFRGFEEFVDVEASGWKGEDGSGTAIKSNPDLIKFYKCLLENFSEVNGSEINLLKIQGECIAGQFCLRVDDTLYILKIGYTEKYSKLAPGNMILERLIKELSDNNDIKYINLVTDSKWHNDWKPLNYKVLTVYIFCTTYLSMVAYLLIKLKQFIRPMYRKYFKPILHIRNAGNKK